MIYTLVTVLSISVEEQQCVWSEFRPAGQGFRLGRSFQFPMCQRLMVKLLPFLVLNIWIRSL